MGWVDLYSNNTFTDAQLLKRYDRRIRTEFPLNVERAMSRRAFGQVKGKYTPTAEEVLQEESYEIHTKAVRVDLEQAKLDNTLLIATLEYESAERRLARYLVSEGVAFVPEVPEIIDEETGEVTQEFVPAIAAIEPLPATVEQPNYDQETGMLIDYETVPNPLIVIDEAERVKAQSTIDNATAGVLNLAVLRTVE